MKKFIVPMLAVIIAFTFSAFTQAKKVSVDGELWYHFVGDATDPSDVANPLMYELDGDGSVPTFCEVTTGYRCQILNKPQIDPELPDLEEEPVLITKRPSPSR